MGDVVETAEAWVAAEPAAPLYSFLDGHGREVESLTRGAFLARVQLIAGHLGGLSRTTAGDRVLVAYPPGLEMICAFFACASLGLIPVPAAAPARTSLQASLYRLEHIASDCDPAAALTTSEVVDLIHENFARPCAPASSRIALLPWIATDAFTTPSPVSWNRRHSPILFLQYTSGSTNQPKGVIVSHDNVLANARLTVDHDKPIGVCWLPHHHDMGLIGYYMNAAVAGGRLYGFSPASFAQRPSLWLRTISKYRATASSAPNFALEHCLRRGSIAETAREDLDLSALKFLMVAAEPVKPDVFRRFLQTYAPFGLRAEALVVAYGLAENTLAVSSYGRGSLSLNRHALAEGRAKVTTRIAEVGAARHLMSCGRPLGDNQILIVDPELNCPRDDGEVGEIWVAGRSKCWGYWNNPIATAEIFAARPTGAEGAADDTAYLRTGDMGFLYEGELYVCGRRKDVIIVRGQNYYPQDIEAVAELASPGLRRGCVAAFEADEHDRPKKMVVAEQASLSTKPDAAAIAAAVRNNLGLNLDEILFVPPKSLPRTTSGKIRRFLAKQMILDDRIPILSRFSCGPAEDLDDLRIRFDHPFAEIRRRYGLTGEEQHSLADAGVDSIDLVVVLHELRELLAADGTSDLAELLDARLVQERSIAELFGVIEKLAVDRTTALAQLRVMVAVDGSAGRLGEHTMMQADRRLSIAASRGSASDPADTARHILMTGATGFFGPFLLTSLLEQTSAAIEVVVRAASDAEARVRLRANLEAIAPRPASFWETFERRVTPTAGDLEAPRLGLPDRTWSRLAEEVDTIYHNGALVNYLLTYQRMRAANVFGTREILRLAFESRRKVLNHVSTTFIFGWATKDVLSESDDNAGMSALDFGYSQSKWVAEQLVLEGRRGGLTTRIFRPALITPSIGGGGFGFDITLRLLAFMIKHGIGVDAANQVSFVPADVTANNVVAIANCPGTADQIFHITRDHHSTMTDVLDVITAITGQRFERFDLPSFVPEVIRRCTREDRLFPLLDFLAGSIDSISAMAFKRYDNENYRRARDASPRGRSDPSLVDTIAGTLRYLNASGLTDVALGTTTR